MYPHTGFARPLGGERRNRRCGPYGECDPLALSPPTSHPPSSGPNTPLPPMPLLPGRVVPVPCHPQDVCLTQPPAISVCLMLFLSPPHLCPISFPQGPPGPPGPRGPAGPNGADVSPLSLCPFRSTWPVLPPFPQTINSSLISAAERSLWLGRPPTVSLL